MLLVSSPSTGGQWYVSWLGSLVVMILLLVYKLPVAVLLTPFNSFAPVRCGSNIQVITLKRIKNNSSLDNK